jgi:hypothetical protein
LYYQVCSHTRSWNLLEYPLTNIPPQLSPLVYHCGFGRVGTALRSHQTSKRPGSTRSGSYHSSRRLRSTFKVCEYPGELHCIQIRPVECCNVKLRLLAPETLLLTTSGGGLSDLRSGPPPWTGLHSTFLRPETAANGGGKLTTEERRFRLTAARKERIHR